jgi:hypothetical protein
MQDWVIRAAARWEGARARLRPEEGFQTAEAIGIAAVGLLVLFVVYVALSALGFDVVQWIRDTFGIGDPAPATPPAP